MSIPHNFTDDPNSFPGPPNNSSNTTVILVAIAVACGTMMLICGGIIFGVVMTVRQAQQEFEMVMGDEQWADYADRTAFREYSEFVAEGRYSEAVENLDSALESNPENPFLHNNKAWLLATAPDDAVRNGELAVEHGTKACDLTNWDTAAFVDTVAAAYAESGDFASAVHWQEEAIRLGGSVYSQDFQRRLRLFKAGKPYREGVPPFKERAVERPAGEQPVEAEATDRSEHEADHTTTKDELADE